jgi:hypothetical protein
MLFDGSDDRMDMANLHNQSVLDTYFVTSTSDTQYLYPNVGTGGSFGFVANLNETATNLTQVYGSPSLYANGTLFTGTRRVDVYNFLSGSKVVVHQGASTSGWSMYSFSGYQYGYEFNGYLQELIAYTSSQADNHTYIENNINAYYNIYTTSSTSTENAFVSTWYDQSGNNRHATQTATGSQPLIVSSGSLVTENGKPGIRFIYDNKTYLFNNTSSLTYTTTFVLSRLYRTDLTYIISSNSNQTGIVGTVGGQYRLYNNTNFLTGIAPSLTNQDLIYSLFNGASSELGIDNNTAIIGNPGSSTFSGLYIGSDSGLVTTTAVDGIIQEIILYSSDQSANRPLIENNINNYYNIYTGSNHGFVARWYDQSGNNNHATQTATGSQPMIVESGSVILDPTSSRPAIVFDGVDDWLRNTTSLIISSGTPASIFAVNRPFGIVLYPYLFDIGQQDILFYYYPSNKHSMYRGSDLSSLNSATANTSYLYNLLYNNTTSELKVNGTTFTGSVGTLSTGAKITIAAEGVYTSDQTVNREPIEYGINNYYNIYPQTAHLQPHPLPSTQPPGSICFINND